MNIVDVGVDILKILENHVKFRRRYNKVLDELLGVIWRANDQYVLDLNYRCGYSPWSSYKFLFAVRNKYYKKNYESGRSL